MIAPNVQIDSQPTHVKFTWTPLTPDFDGGIPTLEYRLEILTQTEVDFADACTGVSDT
jgi:hypothetical protein